MKIYLTILLGLSISFSIFAESNFQVFKPHLSRFFEDSYFLDGRELDEELERYRNDYFESDRARRLKTMDEQQTLKYLEKINVMNANAVDSFKDFTTICATQSIKFSEVNSLCKNQAIYDHLLEIFHSLGPLSPLLAPVGDALDMIEVLEEIQLGEDCPEDFVGAPTLPKADE